MKKIMFDSNIYDRLPEIIATITDNANYEFYITTIQIAELCKISDEKIKIRENNILMLSMLRPKLVPLNTAIYGKCKYGLAKYGKGEAYDKILNTTKSNTNDALIADTAIANNCTLVTDDKRFYEKMENGNYKVLNYDEFIKNISNK